VCTTSRPRPSRDVDLSRRRSGRAAGHEAAALRQRRGNPAGGPGAFEPPVRGPGPGSLAHTLSGLPGAAPTGAAPARAAAGFGSGGGPAPPRLERMQRRW
jgi:hypothetical protein